MFLKKQDTDVKELDALVIGAGVSGLYQLYQLREQGLNVRAYDAGKDVGGTWYWNRYPGCRFDSESYIYQYLFSKELYEGWTWSERFPAQPEIERWMHYVTDKLDLRKDIELDTSIESAKFDETAKRWIVNTSKGDVISAKYVIGCTGMLSAPLSNMFPGQNDFKGKVFHTARWPEEKVELAGKRVGVVGIGATGIQVIQTIAQQVSNLKVFIRTPQYVLPMKNPKYGPKDVEYYKSRFEELRDILPKTFAGFEYDFEHSWEELTPEQRLNILEDFYQNGSLKLWLSSFREVFFDEQISEEVSNFVREKMKSRLRDPGLCDLLIPQDYGFGTHRVPLETDYLEVYHLPHVEAVSVKDNPIECIVADGIKTSDGTVHELDVIILATGFDAGTGALTRIDIRGRNGRSLKKDWGKDIRTSMGMLVHGYPNLFATGIPLAPSAALCNMTTCLQQQTEWISDCIQYLESRKFASIEPTKEFEDEWVQHHDEIANDNLISKTNSWYVGSNVPGKPRRVLSYLGGAGAYREKCTEVKETNYDGFSIA